MRFEAGFTQGASGGNLRITAPSMALDGQFLASTVTGERQATTPPAASSLALVFQAQDPTPPAFAILISDSAEHHRLRVVRRAPWDAFALDSVSMPLPLLDDRKKNVFLSPDLVNTDGFGNLTVDDSDGNITVPQSAALKTQSRRGGFSFRRQHVRDGVDHGSGRQSHAECIRHLSYGFCHPQAHARLANSCRRPLARRLRAGINRASGYIGERHGPSERCVGCARRELFAGRRENRRQQLRHGSPTRQCHHADGGLTVSGSGQITYGAGGSISLAAGQDINLPAVFGGAFSGRLNLGATLSGLSGAKGGSLSILAPFIQVGGQSSHDRHASTISRLFQ